MMIKKLGEIFLLYFSASDILLHVQYWIEIEVNQFMRGGGSVAGCSRLVGLSVSEVNLTSEYFLFYKMFDCKFT